MAPKVLVVLTSQDTIPDTGKPTGWYLPEFAHPYEVLKDKTELTIASRKGGKAPLDPASVEMFAEDPISKAFLAEKEALWTNTVELGLVNPADFDAVFYVGGHGPMFDLYEDFNSIDLINNFSSAKKPLAAVCHGPAVFLKAHTESYNPILFGATVTGFSNDEEDMTGLSYFMPYKLETELDGVSGGGYVKARMPWEEKVVVSKTADSGAVLITGQNPASAAGVAKELLKALGL